MDQRRTETYTLVEGLKRLEKLLDPSKRTLEEVRHEWQEGIKNQVRTLTRIRRTERMFDEVMRVTKTRLYDAPDWFEVYKIVTTRLNYINDHIVVYAVFPNPDDDDEYFLADDGYTINEIEMHGVRIDEEVDIILDYELGDNFWYKDGSYEIVSGEHYTDEDFGDDLSAFLDVIEAVYKAFLG